VTVYDPQPLRRRWIVEPVADAVIWKRNDLLEAHIPERSHGQFLKLFDRPELLRIP
jgi:hypothetical protein